MLAEDLVRVVADGTGYTTVIRIGEQNTPLPVALSDHIDPCSSTAAMHPDYAVILHEAATRERVTTSSLRPWAAALVLPECDVAYLRHGADDMAVLAIGPDPVDDPATHVIADAGLYALMQAMLHAHRASQPSPRGY
jgi:hypothetical protein